MLEVNRDMKRLICPAYQIGWGGCRRFRVHIVFQRNGVLKIHGNWHSQGQIYDDLTDESLIPSDGFECEDLKKIQEIWKRWHLNDLRAGTPKQMEFLRENNITNYANDYKRVCEILESADLLYDNGYKFGSSWLKEEVPDDVIRYLFSLPALSGDSWDDFNTAPIDENDFFAIINMGR